MRFCTKLALAKPLCTRRQKSSIDAAISFARRHNLSPRVFEFQFLYGIRREKQRELVAQGWQVRVYVPYGTAWYPYFMRRLAERPANLWFFMRSLFRG